MAQDLLHFFREDLTQTMYFVALTTESSYLANLYQNSDDEQRKQFFNNHGGRCHGVSRWRNLSPVAGEKRKVIALVRSSSDGKKLVQLKEEGVEMIEGDLKQKDSLEKALQGVSAVITTVSSSLSRQPGDSIQSVDEQGQINLVDAAKEAGVSQFVYISFCAMPGEFPLQTAKRNVEKHLVESGLPYTILQPTYFMEIWLTPLLGFDYTNARATIYGNGEAKVSWISLKDVAAFAVASLDHAAARDRIIELGGPDALSPLEVVEVFETVLGKKFELQFVPEEAIIKQRDSAPDSLSESFAALMLGLAKGSKIAMKNRSNQFAIGLGTVRDYAEQS